MQRVLAWGWWHLLRTVWGVHARWGDYRCPGVQRWIEGAWPRQYSRECPPWGMRGQKTRMPQRWRGRPS